MRHNSEMLLPYFYIYYQWGVCLEDAQIIISAAVGGQVSAFLAAVHKFCRKSIPIS